MITFKFQSLTKPIEFSPEQNDYLNSLKPFSKSDWDEHENEDMMISIKKTIKDELSKIQGDYCIFCGMHKDICARSSFEREHIAPKSKHPEFLFEPYNLVLSCNQCNKLKGKKTTISTYSINYKENVFTIIHPYFDKFDDHIQFVFDKGIVLRYKTEKGKETIKRFRLNETGMVTERGKQINLIGKTISSNFELLLHRILNKNTYST